MGRESDYSYLLGLYLGDGYLGKMRKGVLLMKISLDGIYPEIVRSAADAITSVLPLNAVRVAQDRDSRGVGVYCYSKQWPVLLPQHGPGHKHERTIVLTDWQREITYEWAQDLVRGLIHSDGCRFIARQRVNSKTYPYARYAFTNKSEDIIGIFCEHMDLLGIHWTRITRPHVSHIQIARREAVEALDTFIGPKR